MSNRTDAYLSAQSFLVIAFTSCMGNLNPEWGKLFTLSGRLIDGKPRPGRLLAP